MQTSKVSRTELTGETLSYWQRLRRDLVRNKTLYLMVLPVVAYYIIFCYVPMYGILMAFQDYDPAWGVIGSPWVGFEHFIDFFSSEYFWRLIRNTLTISVSALIFGFPMPIILALLINEFSNKYFVKTVKTISYLPHFISLVVVCGIIKDFVGPNGLIGGIYSQITGTQMSMLMNPKLFVPIYIVSNIWQGMGWDSIIYIAALAGIDSQLYEACKLDGGGRIRQTFSVTLPGILPTIVILLIMRIGGLLSVGYEKIILLYNDNIMETADVISTYVYRKGLQNMEWSFGTAVGLFNSVINVCLLIVANTISRKVSETSLW